MEAEAEILIDLNTQLHSETIVSVQNEDHGVSTSLANDVIMPQQPGQFFTLNLHICMIFEMCLPFFHLYIYLYIAPKKPTRQWAAWTRNEEESFFTALRQVGKVHYYLSCFCFFWYHKAANCNILQCRILRKSLPVYKVKTRIRYACYTILFYPFSFPIPFIIIVFHFISDNILTCRLDIITIGL